jgi:hypothetical protein
MSGFPWLQILASGIQDTYISSAPDITFFNVVHRYNKNENENDDYYVNDVSIKEKEVKEKKELYSEVLKKKSI